MNFDGNKGNRIDTDENLEHPQLVYYCAIHQYYWQKFTKCKGNHSFLSHDSSFYCSIKQNTHV